ncbi:MAG TPA: glutamate--tRNA ligase [Candidatus Babeliales bacterium]|nr:glutamate--tRNA ligase [Candidatus Babeliales bacterium]
MPNLSNVRVRFAPSPTGNLHIGGLRAAIFNWLFARHNDGTFIIRIEDTDKERSTQEFQTSIIDSLAWMQFSSDEQLYIQSEFEDKHKEFLQQLLDADKAYRCYCSELELQDRLGENCKYDQCCRDRDCADASGPYVIRFKVPNHLKKVTFTDLIRGEITIDRDQIDDFIIARSDGSPVYNFVVVIDDAEMRINFVIRGEEHLGNTVKQILLYDALGFTQPEWAHLPLILNPEGGKLSKRDGAVSVIEYKDDGYLPDAVLNYLVRLGWSHGDQEIFTREELIKLFTLDGVGKSGAIFDIEKLNWLNGVYIRESKSEDLLDYIETTMKIPLQQELNGWSRDTLIQVITVYKDRARTLSELIDELRLLHDGSKIVDAELSDKWVTAETALHIERLVDLLESLSQWDLDLIKEVVTSYCKQAQLKLPAIAQPVRLAFIGTTKSPSVFQLLFLLGKDESLKRLRSFIESLG